MPPLVSIIVPVYRVEEYLCRCIDSVLRQTVPDWELILVDDGSPDASGAICDGYAAADGRVTVIHQPNRGLSAARNSGLDAARGSLLTFVDSDDWLHDRFIEELTAQLDREDAQVAACRFRRRSDDLVGDETLPTGYTVLDRNQALRHLMGAEHTVMVIACAKVYRSELFDGVRFPIGRLHEDEFTTYRILMRCSRFVLVDAVLYHYWQRPDSIMGSGYSDRAGTDGLVAGREQLAAMTELGDGTLIALASAQLLRRLVHHYRWLVARGAESTEIDETVADLRDLQARLRSESHPWSLRTFGWLYAHHPALIRRVHSLYLRVLRHTKGQRQARNGPPPPSRGTGSPSAPQSRHGTLEDAREAEPHDEGRGCEP